MPACSSTSKVALIFVVVVVVVVVVLVVGGIDCMGLPIFSLAFRVAWS